MADKTSDNSKADTQTRSARGRPRGAEATRSRILDAASTLIVEGGYQNISVDDIAEKAGFSRRTVYDQFGSKRGVLEGIVKRIGAEGLPELRAAVSQATDPVEALRRAVPLSVGFTDRYVKIVRIFYAQAVNDPDFRAAWEYAEQSRWNDLHRMVEWLAREGRLAEEWTLDRATDWLSSLTGFRLHEELVVNRGWSREEMVQMMLRNIAAVLLASHDKPQSEPQSEPQNAENEGELNATKGQEKQ